MNPSALPRLASYSSAENQSSHTSVPQLAKASPRTSWGLPPRRTYEDILEIPSDPPFTSRETPRTHTIATANSHHVSSHGGIFSPLSTSANHPQSANPTGFSTPRPPPTAPSSLFATATRPYTSQDPFATRPNTVRNSQAENPGFASTVLQMQVKLAELTQRLGGDDRPSAIRLHAVCDLFDQMCLHLGVYQEFALLLREELYYCLFKDYQVGMNYKKYSNLVPWFELGRRYDTEVKALIQERTKFGELRARLDRIESNRLNSLRSIISRWQNKSLASAFTKWRQYVTLSRFQNQVMNRMEDVRNIHRKRTALRHWFNLVSLGVARREIYRLNEKLLLCNTEIDSLQEGLAGTHRYAESMYSQAFFYKQQVKVLRDQLVVEVNDTKFQEGIEILGKLSSQTGNEMMKSLKNSILDLQTKKYQHLSLMYPNLTTEQMQNKASDENREDLLITWANYHLKRIGTHIEIHNFHADVKNGEAYAALLDAIAFSPLTRPVTAEVTAIDNKCVRAAAILRISKQIGCPTSITPEDLSSGLVEHSDLHATFLSTLIMHHPGLSWGEDDLMHLYKKYNQLVELWDDINAWDVKRPLSHDVIDSMLQKTEELKAMIKSAYETSLKDTEIWEKICEGIRDRTQAYIMKRLAGDRFIIDETELKEIEQHGRDAVGRTTDLFGEEVEKEKEEIYVSRLLGLYIGDLKRIYSQYGRGSKMTVHDYREFVVACRLVPKDSNLPLDSIFIDPESLKLQQIGTESIKAEVTFNEFVEAIIRFADSKYKMTRATIRFASYLVGDMMRNCFLL
eukprot:TRINITY_DN6909_c0_g1_i4.p1 TRINITY_DN6909_c0_g1~~TRINITY_DN6909_c0_g1_i4.p1  ORF type:complete len:795 (+),score=139.68 TRINITY_DN6909_c0_g1_i4:43-2427(+)